MPSVVVPSLTLKIAFETLMKARKITPLSTPITTRVTTTTASGRASRAGMNRRSTRVTQRVNRRSTRPSATRPTKTSTPSSRDEQRVVGLRRIHAHQLVDAHLGLPARPQREQAQQAPPTTPSTCQARRRTRGVGCQSVTARTNQATSTPNP